MLRKPVATKLRFRFIEVMLDCQNQVDYAPKWPLSMI